MYLTGVKLEKSAQPVSVSAFGELQPEDSGAAAGEVDTGALGVVELPVSMGMSSKFAVHTGPDPKQDTEQGCVILELQLKAKWWQCIAAEKFYSHHPPSPLPFCRQRWR